MDHSFIPSAAAMGADFVQPLDGKAHEIMDAATRLFAQYGYRKTSIAQIAREAGVAAGTMYLYFNDKEALFRATVHSKIGAILEELRTAVSGIDDWSNVFRQYALTRARIIREDLGNLGVTYERVHERHPIVEDVRAEVQSLELQLITSILRKGAAEGEIVAKDPDLLAQTMQAVLNGFERQMFDEPWERIEAITDTIISMAWQGLAPRHIEKKVY